MAPVVTASGLGMRTRRRWVFRDVDLVADAGDLVAITGPGASGRTSLLLALTGNARHSVGGLHVTGRTALGYVPGVHQPEPGLTVAEHVEERLLLLGRAPWGRGARRRRAAEILREYPGDPAALGRDLDALHIHLLCLTLAGMADPAVIAVDDADLAMSADERTRLWAALRGTGATVLAAAREARPQDEPSTVLTLEGPR